MSALYLVALAGVAAVLLAVLVDTVISVSRKADWQPARFAPRLTLVDTVDRRESQLPFVGTDRRESAGGGAQGTRPAPLAA